MNGPLGYIVASQGGVLESLTAEDDANVPPSEDLLSLNFAETNILSSIPIKSTTTVEEMEAYHAAIESLRRMFKKTVGVTDPYLYKSLCNIWGLALPETFCRLLSEQRPPALVIMAHFTLLMVKAESFWYISERLHHILAAIRRDLPEEYCVYIEHPLRVYEARPSNNKGNAPSASSPYYDSPESMPTPPSQSS